MPWQNGGCLPHKQVCVCDCLVSPSQVCLPVPCPLFFLSAFTCFLTASSSTSAPSHTSRAWSHPTAPRIGSVSGPRTFLVPYTYEALPCCQLLSALKLWKAPLVQTSSFIWDGRVPLQHGWNRASGTEWALGSAQVPTGLQGSQVLQACCPPGHQPLGFNLLGSSQQSSPSVTFLPFLTLPFSSPPVIKTVQLFKYLFGCL